MKGGTGIPLPGIARLQPGILRIATLPACARTHEDRERGDPTETRRPSNGSIKKKRLQQNPADELTSIQTKANPGVQDWNTVSASHDLEGNLTGDGNFTFAYDSENRLVEVTGTGTQVSSLYAGDGGRVARSSSGETRIHILDPGASLQPVLMEIGTNGVPVRYYIWGGVLAAHVDAGGEVRFYHADHQGSTLALTDVTGTVTDQWFHDPYGETLNRTGTTDTPYQWVGGYAVWNEGHGLYRMQARHYHTGLKRFTTTDPLGIQELLGRGGLANLYQYANNSPLVYIDPDGEWAIIDDLIAFGAGAAIGVAGQFVSDSISSVRAGSWQGTIEGYSGAAVGGGFAGLTLLYTANPIAAGMAGGAVSSFTRQTVQKYRYGTDYSATEILFETCVGGVSGMIPGQSIPGVTSGRMSHLAVGNKMITQIQRGQIRNVSTRTAGKMVSGRFVQGAFVEGAVAAGVIHGITRPEEPDYRGHGGSTGDLYFKPKY